MICEECKMKKTKQKYSDVCDDCVMKIMSKMWKEQLKPLVNGFIKQLKKTDK